MSDRRWWAPVIAGVGVIVRKFITPGAAGWLDELLLTLALVLIVVGLWPISSRWIGTGLPSLIVPGMTLLYVVLPPRAPFVARPPAPSESSRRSS